MGSGFRGCQRIGCVIMRGVANGHNGKESKDEVGEFGRGSVCGGVAGSGEVSGDDGGRVGGRGSSGAGDRSAGVADGLIVACGRGVVGRRDPGRPALPPQLPGALRLYATLRDVGSARAVSRLCECDHGFRWLCGDAIGEADYETLRKFRVAGRFEGTLAWTVAELRELGLVSERALSLAVDGTKVRGSTSRGRMMSRKEFERRTLEKVRKLRKRLDDPLATSRERGSRQAANHDQRRPSGW